MSYGTEASDAERSAILVPGTLITGKRSEFRIREYLPILSAGGKYASLYKVSPEKNPYDVYLAKFFRLQVCVNPGPGGLVTDAEQAFRRFTQESKFLQKFDHKSIVKYVDEFKDIDSSNVCSDKCFYVMEYLKGLSLRDTISKNVPTANIVNIAKGITEGLIEIHRQGIIHRDFTPGNIFLCNGIPKIIDFGQAIDTNAPHPYQDELSYRRIAGTLHRAPEAKTPFLARLESDIFSFGVTILEFANKNLGPSGVESEHQKQQWIASNLDLLGRFHPQLHSLVQDMLNERPERRPTSRLVLERLNTMSLVESHQVAYSYPTEQSTYGSTSRYSEYGALDNSRSRDSRSYSTYQQDSKEESWGGLIALAVGAGIGALLALIFAPKAGSELRSAIADATRKGLDYARDTGSGKESVADLTERGKDLIARQKAQFAAAIEAGKQGYREAKAAKAKDAQTTQNNNKNDSDTGSK